MTVRRLRLIVGIVAMLLPIAGYAQRFDNDAVKTLRRAGLGEAAIVAKVNSLPCGYDISTDGLISLKQAGLPDLVIAAMVNRCATSARAQAFAGDAADPSMPHPPGIYVLQDWVKPATLQSMRPSKASGLKVTGNGSILMPFVARLVLPEAASRTAIKGVRPSFFFYFNVADKRVSDFGSANSAVAQSPDEFTLVRLRVKPNEREVGMGKVSRFGINRGIDTNASIAFLSQEVGDGAYKVTFDAPLPVGEYAFVLTGANNAARVYDFSIG